jgi:MFS family permease
LIAVFLRFMQGLGDAIAINSSKVQRCSSQNVVYSAVAFEFQEIREVIFGVLEAAYGLGFAAGPLIGQVLYSLYGFQ